MKDMVSINTYIFFVFFIFITNLFVTFAAIDCSKVDVRKATPAQLFECGSPDDNVTKNTGSSLYSIIMLISNTLAIITVFFSIIGAIVGIIGLIRSQGNKTQMEEAQGVITNSILAFIIVASLWVIVRLVFNTFGIGDIAPAPVTTP